MGQANIRRAEGWVVLCEVGETKYLLDGRIFSDFWAAVDANENAGWPGTSAMIVYPTREERNAQEAQLKKEPTDEGK